MGLSIDAVERRLNELAQQGRLSQGRVQQTVSRLRAVNAELDAALNDASQERNRKVDAAVDEFNDALQELGRLSKDAREV